MNSPSLRRKVVLLLLLTTLAAAPWAAAGPRRESPQAPRSAAPWLLDLVRRAWSLWLDVHLKEGCYIDPNGGTAAQTDTGCYIDPNGLCRL